MSCCCCFRLSFVFLLYFFIFFGNTKKTFSSFLSHSWNGFTKLVRAQNTEKGMKILKMACAPRICWILRFWVFFPFYQTKVKTFNGFGQDCCTYIQFLMVAPLVCLFVCARLNVLLCKCVLKNECQGFYHYCCFDFNSTSVCFNFHLFDFRCKQVDVRAI